MRWPFAPPGTSEIAWTSTSLSRLISEGTATRLPLHSDDGVRRVLLAALALDQCRLADDPAKRLAKVELRWQVARVEQRMPGLAAERVRQPDPDDVLDGVRVGG